VAACRFGWVAESAWLQQSQASAPGSWHIIYDTVWVRSSLIISEVLLLLFCCWKHQAFKTTGNAGRVQGPSTCSSTTARPAADGSSAPHHASFLHVPHTWSTSWRGGVDINNSVCLCMPACLSVCLSVSSDSRGVQRYRNSMLHGLSSFGRDTCRCAVHVVQG
jgi:hypothetical protein